MTDDRKQDHIDLAFNSIPPTQLQTGAIFYEPLLGTMKSDLGASSFEFAGARLKFPFWVSSMTGGTEKAKNINANLARACREFGFGMGLGSCRPLLEDKRWEDFSVRNLIGDEAPLYTNFGIAQLEELLDYSQVSKLDEITKKLQATGIIIHINPLQEFAQPEGDRYSKPALDSIKRFLDQTSFPVIVKEVGQGIGPKSLEELVKLPLEAIEFAGFGGTNFTLLEKARQRGISDYHAKHLQMIGSIGHTPSQMIDWINSFDFELTCQSFIISGGIDNPVEGHILNEKLQYKSVIGMASQFLKYATGEYTELENYINSLLETYKLCSEFIRG